MKCDYSNQDMTWLKILSVDEKGNYSKTIRNIHQILLSDPFLKGCFSAEFYSRRWGLTRDLPWRTINDNSWWTDSDESCLRCFLESNYGVEGSRKIKDALIIVFSEQIKFIQPSFQD